MPVTKKQAERLTQLAIDCRPYGAPKWDGAGIMAAIAKVNTLALADVAAAVIRAASDRTAETPAVIAATNSLHWSERMAERTTPTAPRREQACVTCGRHLDACVCGERRTRPAEPTTPTAEFAAARAALRGDA